MDDSTVYILGSNNCHPESFVSTYHKSVRFIRDSSRLPEYSLGFQCNPSFRVTHKVGGRQHPKLHNATFNHVISWLPPEQTGSNSEGHSCRKGTPTIAAHTSYKIP